MVLSQQPFYFAKAIQYRRSMEEIWDCFLGSEIAQIPSLYNAVFLQGCFWHWLIVLFSIIYLSTFPKLKTDEKECVCMHDATRYTFMLKWITLVCPTLSTCLTLYVWSKLQSSEWLIKTPSYLVLKSTKVGNTELENSLEIGFHISL